MTKAEAIKALKEGKAISHRLFLADEFIREVNGVYIDEKGNHLNIGNFWRWRKGMWWETDYLIYGPVKVKA